jgi:hypothetical protein
VDNAQPTPASKPPADAPGTQPAPAPSAAGKQSKSEQTRSLILETALRLFQERGYDKTTMRAIATEAGVSVGNAYYYFESKERRRNFSKPLRWPTASAVGVQR